MHGCGGSAQVDDDGGFVLEVLNGPPCQVSYASKNMGVGPWVDPVEPPPVLVVEPEAPVSIRELMERKIRELEHLEDTPEAVDVALEEGVDPALRSTLERWSRELHEERLIELDGLRQTIE